jgi:hypothetical protein
MICEEFFDLEIASAMTKSKNVMCLALKLAKYR